MDEFTPDSTVIADAENFCIDEQAHGREPVFTPILVGAFSTWRQRRLFESAMNEYMTRGTALHELSVASVNRFRG